MSDRQWYGIFSICAGAYMLYVAMKDPGTAVWFHRLVIELTGLNFVLSLYISFGLIGVFIALGLFLLFYSGNKGD